jgi:hypothetical protein
MKRHSQISEALGRNAEITEIDSIVREARLNRVSTFPRWLYLAGAGLFAVTEALAIVQILKLEGVEPFARLLMGAATSAFAIAMTSQVAAAVTQLMRRGREWPLWRVIATFATYFAFIAVCTMIRAQDSGNHALLFALLMGWATIGAPWLAELCLHSYKSAVPQRDLVRTLGRERRTLARRRESAGRLRGQIEHDAEAWERNELRLRAAYSSAWQRAHADRTNLNGEVATGRRFLPPGQ